MIGIACDHGGLSLKKELIEYLKELNYEVKDYGTMTEESVDYPKYAFLVGEAVVNKEIEKGILICKTGIGMSIACNKVKGVRCAKVDNIKEAELTRLHNNSNVLTLNSENKSAKDIVKIFLETSFSNDERHINRINMISNYEEKHEY